jgi:hypothetical protein
MTTASTLNTNAAANLNTVMHGNCVEIMSGMQSGSIDFVITDPPYITRYCARDGRTVANDDNARWLQARLRPDAPAYEIRCVLRELLRLEQGGSVHRRMAQRRFSDCRPSGFPQEVRFDALAGAAALGGIARQLAPGFRPPGA